MTALAVAIYLGGACMDYHRPIGFWKRLFWPHDLGAAVFRWVLKQEEARK